MTEAVLQHLNNVILAFIKNAAKKIKKNKTGLIYFIIPTNSDWGLCKGFVVCVCPLVVTNYN